MRSPCDVIYPNLLMNQCLLVKGWKSSSGWGFPKGKINEDEPPPTCAIREVRESYGHMLCDISLSISQVLEETGYNLAGKINPDDVIEMSIREQKISLFIVPGVPEDFPFKTKTRKEISVCNITSTRFGPFELIISLLIENRMVQAHRSSYMEEKQSFRWQILPYIPLHQVSKCYKYIIRY